MLSTDRIRLRAAEPEDLDIMYLIENDDSLWAYGTTTVPYSYHSLRQFIADTRNDIYQDGQLRLVVESIPGREPLGFIDLQNLELRHRRAEVGIVLLPGYQGKGLASEALRLLCSYASRHLGLRQLTAIISVRNSPARNLFLRCGFHRLAILPHWLSCQETHDDAELYLWE